MITDLQVPFLKDTEIEAATLDLLSRYARWKGTPVDRAADVDDIIENFLGIDFAVVDLPAVLGMPGVIGATFFAQRKIMIDESLEGREGRLSFTLAHELGHWELHRPIFEQMSATPSLFDASDVPPPPSIVCRTSRKPRIEIQADRFAAYLLMPAAAVRKAFRSIHGERVKGVEGLDERRSRKEFDEELYNLAAEVIVEGGFTNVSNEAMRYRLLDLRLVADAATEQPSLL